MSDLDRVLDTIDADLDNALERLFVTLRLKSISTDPAYAAETRACAEWHAADLRVDRLRRVGARHRGHPMVVGHQRDGDGPSVLFYGHYDVQPVDPLELWENDPFDPKIVTRPDGTKMLVGRGTADDKGQLMTFVEACRVWKPVTGKLPVPVTVLLEGEEDGRRQPAAVPRGQQGRTPRRHRADLRHQHVGRGDAGDHHLAARALRRGDRDPRRRPGPAFGLLRLGGGEPEPHAGPHHRRPARPRRPGDAAGFYDGVPELPDALRRAGASSGSARRTSSARSGSRSGRREGPLGAGDDLVAADLRGQRHGRRLPGRRLQDGDPGAGDGQGVVPAGVRQDPHKVRAAFREHVKARLPADCTVDFHEHGGGTAVAFDTSGPVFQKTQGALTDEWGKQAAFVGGGGSIPVTTLIKRSFGVEVVMAGFGLADDRIHSPNEKYELKSFHKGIRSWARVLDALAG